MQNLTETLDYSGHGNDETDIVVAGLGDDGHVYVLDDASGKL